jgi:hypothetical protein
VVGNNNDRVDLALEAKVDGLNRNECLVCKSFFEDDINC